MSGVEIVAATAILPRVYLVFRDVHIGTSKGWPRLFLMVVVKPNWDHA